MISLTRIVATLSSLALVLSLVDGTCAQSQIPKTRLSTVEGGSVRIAVTKLYSTDPYERCQGLRELLPLSPSASAALPWVIEALGDEEYEGNWDPSDRVCEAAEHLLMKMGANAEQALLDALDHATPAIRERAARELGRIGCHRAIDPLLLRLQTQEVNEAWGVVAALGELEATDATPHICSQLQSSDRKTVVAAVGALGKLRDPQAVPSLVDYCIQNAGSDTADGAVTALYSIDGAGFDAAIQLLRHQEPKVRNSATRGLAHTHDERLIEPLLANLVDEDRFVQGSAAQALRWIVGLRGVAPAQRAFEMKKAAGEVRRAAVVVLSKHHSDPVPYLIEALSDQNESVQATAAGILRNKPDRRAASALTHSLQHAEHNGIRADAAAALGAIGDRQHVDALIDGTRDETARTRAAAARALGMIEDPQAIPRLLEMLNDSGWDARRAAAAALATFDDPRVLPAITLMASNSKAVDRSSAVWALASIQGEAAAELLIEALADRDLHVRLAARTTLIRSESPYIDRMLDKALKSDDVAVRKLVRQIIDSRSERASSR